MENRVNFIVHTPKGIDEPYPFQDIRPARSTSQYLNDEVWKRTPKAQTPTYIQYMGVPDDVIKFEELFDGHVTERLCKLLSNETSTLGRATIESLRDGYIIDGEMTSHRVVKMLYDFEERGYLEGLSLRRVNMQAVRDFLMDNVIWS